MQALKSASLVAGALFSIWMAACVVDEPINARSNAQDAGKGGSGGQSSSGTSGTDSTGTSGSNTSGGGDNNPAGSGGSIVAGSGGSTGGSMDASSSSDGTGGGASEAGPSGPDAGTCAGFALKFDGSSYLVIDRLVQDDFTLEAWLKTDQMSLTGTNFWDGTGLIYADQPMTVDDFGTSMLNGHFTIGVGNPDTTLQGTSLIDTGQWVHIAATREKSTGTIQVIVNGMLETSNVVSGQTRSLTAPPNITIGGNTIDKRYLTGTMDEIRLWSIVRKPADIVTTMHKTLTGNEAGLVGYWKFDEGTGTSSTGMPGGAATFNGNPQFVASDAPICP
jgi:hypothetical protein